MRYILLVFFAVLVLGNSYAQDQRTKTFPLGKPLKEEVTVCFEKQAAINIVNAAVQNGQEANVILGQYRILQVCGVMQATITYFQRIHQVTFKNGAKLNVYEGKIGVGNTTIFAITDWNHAEIFI